MRVTENKIGARIRLIRGKDSYAKVEKELKSAGIDGCAFSPEVLCRYENSTSTGIMPPTELLLAFAELQYAGPDELLFGSSIAAIDGFLSAYLTFVRKSSRLGEFLDRCAEIAEPYESQRLEESDDSSLYASRLKEVRLFCGKSPDDTASAMGCHRSTIFRNENSKNDQPPKLLYLFTFCNCLEVSADYILLGGFYALPPDLRGILDGLPYWVQLELLEKFMNIFSDFL